MRSIAEPYRTIYVGYDKRELIEGAIDRDEDRDGDVFNASAGYIRLFKEGKGAFNVYL